MQTYPRIGYLESIKNAFKNYVKFTGRTRRSEFWSFYLTVLAINTILITLMILTLESYESSYRSGNYIYYYKSYKVNPILQLISTVFGLAMICPVLSSVFRRIQDTGRNPAYLLMVLIPIAGIIIVIVFLCKDSEAKPNMYGPSPKYISTNEANMPLNTPYYNQNPYPNNNAMQLNVNPQQNLYPLPQSQPQPQYQQNYQNTNDLQLNVNPQQNPYPLPQPQPQYQQNPSEIPPAGYSSQPNV